MNTIFKNHSKVLFQGDSITDWGRSGGLLTDTIPDGGELGKGYVWRAVQIYRLLFPQNEIAFINRGISGNRVIDLLSRYEEDFEQIEPDYLSVMIGINDTWRRYDSGDATSAEAFEANYRLLLERFKSSCPQARIMLIEPVLLSSDPEKEIFWEDLNPKIRITRKLAEEYADVYLPLNGIFSNYLIQGMKPNEISEDGVHLTDTGNALLAKEYLAAWAKI